MARKVSGLSRNGPLARRLLISSSNEKGVQQVRFLDITKQRAFLDGYFVAVVTYYVILVHFVKQLLVDDCEN